MSYSYERLGTAQNLGDPDRQPIREGDAWIQCVRTSEGLTGVVLEQVAPEPVFVSCEELFGLEVFLTRNRPWLRTQVAEDRAWEANQVRGTVLVHLQSTQEPDRQIVVKLSTENGYGWYGTPQGADEVQGYPRADWQEVGTRERRDLPE
jgi:hypothetical protein